MEEEANQEEIPLEEVASEMTNDADPEGSAEEKFDEDYGYLLLFVPTLLQVMQDEHEKKLCQEWLIHLGGLITETLGDKRDRNLYLINLMLNMGSGTLKSPFNQPPPAILEKGLDVFGGKLQPDVCYQNLSFEVEDFAEYSKDGRTYFAARALPGGNGAFGYLAITLGGGDTMWLDCQGKYVDPRSIVRRSACDEESKETTETFEKMKKLVSRRSPQKDHSELVPYYNGLLERIENINVYYGTGYKIFDPVVEKLLENLQMDIIRDGKIDLSEIGCYNKQEWLCTLKEKIERHIQNAEEREVTLNNLEQMISDHEKDEITFLDLSRAIKPPKLDPILTEAARDRPASYYVNMLKKKYFEPIVNIFLKLLEQEKIHVINHEGMAYQNFVTILRDELLNEVRRGLDKYHRAQKEWQCVTRVIMKVEEERNKMLKEMEGTASNEDPDFQEKDTLIKNEIELAQVRFEEAQAQSDTVEGKINRLHEQVQQLSMEFQRMEVDGKRETEHHLKEISELQSQVATSQRKLQLLKSKFAENNQAEICIS